MPCGKTEQWAKSREKTDLKKRGGAGAKAAVIKRIQAEAKKNGATLKSDGKGGLDPRLALAAFRKASWRCRVPGCKTPKKDLDLDHLGGHEQELEQDPKAATQLKKSAAKGKQNNLDGVSVICAAHHNDVHDRERAIENGKKPAPLTK
jgi:hypothetical protein